MRGSIVTFSVGVIIAVLAVFLMNRFMATRTDAPEAVNGVAMGGVVVAQRDLKVGTPLRADLLIAQQWPANVRPALSFPSPQDVLGDGSQPRVLLHDVRAGEPILQ